MAKTHWLRTVGAPEPGDPRDGELHQVVGSLPLEFWLEAWGDESEDEIVETSVRYVKSKAPASEDEEGRVIWVYEYRPDGDYPQD